MKPLFALENIDIYINRFVTNLVDYVPSLISAIVVLIIGILIIKLFRKIVRNLMTRKNLDPTLLKFVLDVFTWVFRVLLFVTVIEQLGVKTTSLMAALGAAGIAIGLALQGSLSNFAGGLLIILFKPFRVGDYIEAQGQAGTVNSIQIFSTKIITSNNQVIYMPNGALSNGTIKNFSQEPLRRAEIVLSVGYESDLKKVKEAIFGVIERDTKVLKEPAPGVEIKALAENSIDLSVTLWTERANHGKAVSDFYENIKASFENAGITIPYPQRDVHVKNDAKK
ncbi:mechanosensitive ion channel protein MscS [Flavobacterium album]|uniref:Mechanosensitive ion channel protein MscS n=1 Tax=Flavobacterium album TaxID=2175091 RepID=A0A2S1QWY0_9FLAO|nr:mechanosensitive ion channel domain-containing protein [Flavobacterium album]AWH84908.1 mechanosensitive ion channel protein MscS [Flavobacterium album]